MSHRRAFAAGIVALPLVLVLLPSVRPAEDDGGDLALLRSQKVSPEPEALLTFLREHSLDDAGQRRITELIARLGSEEFTEREAACEALIARGPLAVPFLKKALDDADAEVVRRARMCLEKIDPGPGPELPAAVLRLLARHKSDGAVAMVLRYAPHAEATTVEDEVTATLVAIGVRDGKVDPALVAALNDKNSARRAAAAGAVARCGDADRRAAAARLLVDPEPVVRFRVALGLLAARDRAGLAALVGLLGDAPQELAGRAEDALLRLAGEQVPDVSTAASGTSEERKRWKDAWENWRKEHGDKVDLARLDGPAPFMGLTLVPEMHGGKVWEVDRSGKVRWQITGLTQPRDAYVLPSGNVLICEASLGRVIECNRAGKTVWTHALNDPAYIEGLSNGNIFMGNHQRACEITRAGKEVWSYEAEMGFFVHSMNRRPNGNLVCLSMDGRIREVDPKKKIVCEFRLTAPGGNWCGVQGLPGRRYLAVELNGGNVYELDDKGKVHWQCQVNGASYAIRRPNGATMVCCFGGQRIVDVDRKGKIIWEQKVGSSPWRAHSR